MLGVLHSTRRKNTGKNLRRKHLELSERRRAFARKRRRGKRAERKAARKKQKATRVRSRLDELTLGTLNVRTEAVNGANGIGHIDTLVGSCAAKGCDAIGLQETKRDGTFEVVASGYRVSFSGDYSGGVKGRKGQDGAGLVRKGGIAINAGKDGFAIDCISARLPQARNSITSNSLR